MQMDEGLDTGPIVDVREVAVAARETAGSLQDKLARLGAAAIVDVLDRLRRDRGLVSTPQPEEGVSYATKISRADARIDWTREAEAIDRQVRAFDPSPGAFTALDGVPLKVWRADPLESAPGLPPGTILAADDSLVVACGRGALRVMDVQPAGGKRMDARAFASGRALARGSRLVSPAA